MTIFDSMSVGGWIGICVGALVVGAIAGFLISRWFFKKQLKDNPPINEKMIRVMLTQMGRKPSEKQVREIMKNMNDANR